MKKYNFVYKTTNLINGKIYIGVHSTNNLDDGYLGSGNLIVQSIKKYGKENFSREILEYFDTREEAYFKESEIVSSEFILRDNVYNITEGGMGVLTHSQEGLQKLSEINKTMAIMREPNGKIIKISKNDSRFESLVGHTKGMVCAKDKNGIDKFVTKEIFDNDLTLVGRTYGISVVKCRESGEIIQINKNEFDSEIHKGLHSDRITAKDISGNTYSIDKNDPRYLSGELVGVMKGVKFKQKHPQKRIKCSYCEKTGIASNMFRWHYEKCKFKI